MHFYAESSSWSTEVQDNITHPLAQPGSEKKKKTQTCSVVSSLPFVYLKLT